MQEFKKNIIDNDEDFDVRKATIAGSIRNHDFLREIALSYPDVSMRSLAVYDLLIQTS